MPKGYTVEVFRRLCLARLRYRHGELHEQTPDSLRLRFGRWLFEHGVVNEGEDGANDAACAAQAADA